MLSQILIFLGLKSPPRKARTVRPSARPRSATSHLFEKRAMQSSSSAKPSAETDFNPYNTGKFDRGASWERISKSQR
jgi:hypothetical protein